MFCKYFLILSSFFIIPSLLGKELKENSWFLEQAKKKFNLAKNQDQQGIIGNQISNQLLRQAALLYLPLLKKNNNWENHFEVGHIYYQLQNFVLALYHYRQSQFLNPLNDQIIDNIQETRKKLFTERNLSDSVISWNSSLFQLRFFSLGWGAMIFVIFYILFWLWMIYLFLKKKRGFIKPLTILVSLFLLFTSTVFFLKWKNKDSYGVVAVDTEVYQSPALFYSKNIIEKGVEDL